MLYYLIPLVLIFIAAIEHDYNNNNVYGFKILWWIIFLYLTLLMGLRYEVGGDTINYMNFWETQQGISHWKFTFKGYFAPGYSLLTAFSYTLSSNYFVFQFIHSILFNILLFVFFSRNTKYRFASLFVVFFLVYLYFATEILRESLAVLVFLFNSKNIEKRRWIRYYLGVALSCMFHYSAIILFFVPLVTRIRFNKFYILLCVIVLIFSALLAHVFDGFTNLPFINNKLSSYIEEGSQGKLADTMRVLRLFVFPTALAVLYKYGMHTKIRYENYIAIYALLGLASLFVPTIFSRLTNYFIIFYLISFAELMIESLKKTIIPRHNAMIVLCCFVIIYGSEHIFYKKYTRWIPYYSIMNPHHVNRDNYHNLD